MKGSEPCPPRQPLSKIAWSWLGAFAGIYLVAVIHQLGTAGLIPDLFLIGSFGASAVLVFGAPSAEFSQPRNLLGGHVISALTAVALVQWLPLEVEWLAALVVSLSIALMQLTRTLHPPGGATALIAVIGGDPIRALGFGYVLSPVAVGAGILLLVALGINNLSTNPRRHYPRYWV